MKSIETRYIGPTNHRGARIKATDGDNSIITSYPYELSGEAVHAQAALALARKLNWKGTLIGGGTKKGYVFVFSDGERYQV